MKDSYDFSKGKRGAVAPTAAKTRVTIYLDNDLLEEFRARAERLGKGYQTLINEALRNCVAEDSTINPKMLRKILREELKRAAKP